MDVARNFTYLAFGLIVAWAILVAYVLLLVSREKKIRSEMQNLKRMIEDKERK
ncbi:MAG: hypothetical protein IT161_16060 [Bryobacterales bacterium]|nr:hypothetical protein [Bryobacterales bacterium]